jgi:hypothetical protein
MVIEKIKILFFTLFFLFGINPICVAEEYKIIYIIHGDGNYLFHDKEGNALDAAERILNQAKYVAENIKRGEVSIFYQKPAENFLLFFPKDDGEFYHYKNGLKISEGTYSRKDTKDFEIETELIKQSFGTTSDQTKNILLYYGHEIPSENNSAYHSSYPDKEFGIKIFSDGINRLSNLLSSEKKFDLIILSTCKNGTEETIKTLSPYTDYLIASPGDIHLSHLNSESLINLNRDESFSVIEIANEFTFEAYNILSVETSTEITISVYDLTNIEKEENLFTNSKIKDYYRPPEFGRSNK